MDTMCEAQCGLLVWSFDITESDRMTCFTLQVSVLHPGNGRHCVHVMIDALNFWNGSPFKYLGEDIVAHICHNQVMI